MKRFHITITNNETRETLVDTDSGAIVAAIDEGEGTRAVQFTHCDLPSHAAALISMQKTINKTIGRNPILGVLVRGYFEHAGKR